MNRFEVMLAGLMLATWLSGTAAALGWLPLAGSLPLSLYGLYVTAAALGWLAGNVYVARARKVPAPVRRWLRALYLFAPMGVLFVLQAMGYPGTEVKGPLVPLYSFGVFGALFLVPVVLRPKDPGRQ